MEQAIDNLPDRTAKKVEGVVEAIVEKGADAVKDHFDKKIDAKFEQIFGKGAREDETYEQAKARLKNARQNEDLALRQENTRRRREQAAEVKKQQAEDRKAKLAEDKKTAATAVVNEEAVGVEDAMDIEQAAVDLEEVAKAKKAAAKAKSKAKGKAEAKSVTPMLVEH